jgi:hypothetical protein
MAILPHWNLISARIKGLAQAANLYAYFQAKSSGDGVSLSQILISESLDIRVALEQFVGAFSESLPDEVSCRVRAVLDCGKFNQLHEKNGSITQDEKISLMKNAVLRLVTLDSAASFLLRDNQEFLKRRSELALLHLQRSISVDEEIRGKWVKAFNDGEVNCERLGSLALLQHGIFAFKVDASKARTDLVFGEKVDDSSAEIANAVNGFVLTEWKMVKEETQLEGIISAAKKQIKLYEDGPLLHFELAAVRYIVLVSKKKLSETNFSSSIDIQEGKKIRVVNIAVDPDNPSKEASRSKNKR